ncbi:cryptochrome/photolyase family protein [Lutimaribacter sp. EGI FJ00015]|uniref:Cryptochrome/photolyase family protein n=1 Tax=Lutimaribacter degradans TaxID=2945989 RepID=A0ACC5ZZ02_9RHOB|nr:cryptochrome/photolyase family protein [Lutimaribacter sp. EGI FJ00013]MCO0614717.1 cryptochrome/photolyase family protein [Lutimaribacter sp. EGI FJ00015]MCO0637387.1 cryptochrome/photolyase family protein [Lutimaribacter sp. EGI FJ00014]
MTRLVLVLGDQLTPDVAALRAADKARDVVVMAEVGEEGRYVPHHPKKIALILSAMRHFAQELERDGWSVAYTRLDDPENAGTITGELLRRAEEHGATDVIATRPGEWRLVAALDGLPIPVQMHEDDRFVCSHREFEAWAEGRKQLRMEYFYRQMRRKTGLMMDGDSPVGGKWNFDHDNRKPAQDDMLRAAPMQFTPDAITGDVLDLVEARFGQHFGQLRQFWFAVTREQARRALDHFARHLLAGFGDYQDAMLRGDRFLHHSVLSPYLNIGLLSPLEICERVEREWRAGRVPINAAEGYIRQVIGWREYMRGIYFREGPDYPRRNALNHQRALPGLYWGGETGMECLKRAVEQTGAEGYAHHIQRLMVTGNFALLAGVNPTELHEWYLAVYADAFEWVEAPNTVGMSQFADGGIVGSKPYVSSGNYIDKMSDYCGACAYSVKKKTGQGACPFNLLYWHFLLRHRERFEKNPRMAQMYRTWDRMHEDKRETVISEADDFLDRLNRGEPV